MTTPTATTAARPLDLRALVPFLAITFGLAWGILALYIALPGPMAALFGQLSGDHPLFFLAVWAPAIAALLIVGRHAGAPGLRRYLRRATAWRCPRGWALFLLAGVPAVFYAGAALNGNLRTEPLPVASPASLPLVLLLAAIKGPVEELGWRGLALPLLQRRLAPAWAALVLGSIWGFWHVPAFLLGGTQQSAWSFTPFFLGTIAISVIATALFNASRGSILLAAVLHFQLMNPIWPAAQPYDSVLLAVLAAAVLWRERRTMFHRAGGVTEIVPAAGEPTTAPATVSPVFR